MVFILFRTGMVDLPVKAFLKLGIFVKHKRALQYIVQIVDSYRE